MYAVYATMSLYILRKEIRVELRAAAVAEIQEKEGTKEKEFSGSRF